MTLQQLLEERRIYKGTIARTSIISALKRAQRDITTARKVLDIDTDWAFSIAYNGVLQASRAFMFAHGYRPATNEGHKNTFSFMLTTADEEMKPLIAYFDRMRVKRHHVTYDAAGAVTETETSNLLARSSCPQSGGSVVGMGR